jgi:beta-glucosidase-like glycosyl hydrolase
MSSLASRRIDETTSTTPLPSSTPPASRGRRTLCSSSIEHGGKARPFSGTASPVALAIAAISMPDLVPSMKEQNICAFMPASAACSAVSPYWSHTLAGVRP